MKVSRGETLAKEGKAFAGGGGALGLGGFDGLRSFADTEADEVLTSEANEKEEAEDAEEES